MDKRPLGYVGAVFFLTILVLSRVGFEKSVFVLPVCLLAVFLVFLKQKKLKFFAIITSSVLCASIIFGVSDGVFRRNEDYFSGKNVSVEGVICDRPYFNNEKQYVVIKTDKVNGEEVNMKIRVSTMTLPENTELYSKVKLKANLYKADSFDDGVMRSFRAKNIPLTGSVIKNTLKISENESKPLMYHILSFRYRVFDTIKSLLPNDIGGFIAGIVMGDTTLMSGELTEKFYITGTVHILVVSGLHTAIWSGFLYEFLKLFLSRKFSAILSTVFLILFMAFTGFTPSVIRAGVMMIIVYLSIIFGEKPDPFNSLGLSAILLVSVNPFSIFSVGTVFSFASVFGILLMNKFVYARIKENLLKIKLYPLRKFVDYLVGLILVSLTAEICTFPISVLYDINFSYLSVISNLLIGALCTFTMVTGGLGTLMLMFLPEFILGKITFGSSILSSKVIIEIIEKLSQFKEFYRNVSTFENELMLALLLILFFFIVISALSAKKKVIAFTAFLIPVILISNLVPKIIKTQTVELSVIDVGYGMCVTLSHNDETIMFGCGGGYSADDKITSHLQYRGVDRIKALYLPVNKSTTFVKNAKDIKKNFQVDSVITSSQYEFKSLSENTVSADFIDAEYFDGKVSVDFFTQKNSSFALISAGDKRILINFYGSLKKENLPQSCINPDIYVTMYENTYKTDFSFTEDYVVSHSYIASYPVTAKNVHTTFNDSTYTKLILI